MIFIAALLSLLIFSPEVFADGKSWHKIDPNKLSADSSFHTPTCRVLPSEKNPSTTFSPKELKRLVLHYRCPQHDCAPIYKAETSDKKPLQAGEYILPSQFELTYCV